MSLCLCLCLCLGLDLGLKNGYAVACVACVACVAWHGLRGLCGLCGVRGVAWRGVVAVAWERARGAPPAGGGGEATEGLPARPPAVTYIAA